MKTVIYTCNRCGSRIRVVNEDDGVEDADKGRSILVAVLKETQREPAVGVLDLCPDCQDSFTEWLQGMPIGGLEKCKEESAGEEAAKESRKRAAVGRKRMTLGLLNTIDKR